MKATIMQPAYLPWLGYFDRICKSDLLIVLDDVNMDSNSKTKFANRNKIRTSQGWTWLTVPLMSKGRHGSLFLNNVEPSNEQPWRAKHYQSLRNCYSRSPFFCEHQIFFENLYAKEWPRLIDLISASTSYLLDALSMRCESVKSSDIKVSGVGSDLILDLCRHVGATTYISGPFGRNYLSANRFAQFGIQVVYHDYNHPSYSQVFPGFEPYMSVVDLLFNHGPKSQDILVSR